MLRVFFTDLLTMRDLAAMLLFGFRTAGKFFSLAV